jgi:hypothetical protein
MANGTSRIAALIALGAFLSACGTAAQRQAQAITANNAEASQNFLACRTALYNSPSYEPVRRHEPSDIMLLSLPQIMDQNRATDVEVAAILAWHSQIQVCRKAFLDEVGRLTPAVVPIFAAQFTEGDNSLVDLIQRKESWGEHEKRMAAAHDEAVSRNAAETQRINAGLQQSSEAELQRRQQAGAAILQYVQTQEMINSMNRPVFTNCNAFGNSVNCISH